MRIYCCICGKKRSIAPSELRKRNTKADEYRCRDCYLDDMKKKKINKQKRKGLPNGIKKVKKMEDEDVDRILKNFRKMGDRFERIDEQIDASLKVSQETLRKVVGI